MFKTYSGLTNCLYTKIQVHFFHISINKLNPFLGYLKVKRTEFYVTFGYDSENIYTTIFLIMPDLCSIHISWHGSGIFMKQFCTARNPGIIMQISHWKSKLQCPQFFH